MKKLFVIIILSFAAMGSYSQTYQIDWQNCYGGTDREYATDIVPDGSGYLILGAAESEDGDVGYNRGHIDGWLVKTDSLGDLLWRKSYGGTKDDYLQRIIPAPNHHYYLVGSSESSDWDLTGDPYPDSKNVWVMKIDSVGNRKWSRLYGGTGGDLAYSAMLDADSNLVVLGTTGSDDGDVSLNFGAADIWMIKVNSEGELLWDFSSGTDLVDAGRTIIPTSDGGYLLGCVSDLGFMGFLTCMPRYTHNIVLIRLDADRNMLWHQCYGGNDVCDVTEIIALDDGYMILANTAADDGDLQGVEVYGEKDIWVMRTDFYGNVLWQKCYGGPQIDIGTRVFETGDGNFTIIGYTGSDYDDESQNLFESQSDIWVLTISGDGTLLSERSFGGTNHQSLLHGVIRKSDLSYVVAATTNYGPSQDITCTVEPMFGLYYYPEIWTFKISDTLTALPPAPAVETDIKVYPNPARDYVCFEYSGQQKQEAGILIFNSMGAQISNPVLYNSGSKIIWDTRQVPPGVYFYTWSAQEFTGSGKIVISE
ncbi:MAG: T9SS type A sorting domain-containing protein [Bacteroidales bacterium]